MPKRASEASTIAVSSSSKKQKTSQPAPSAKGVKVYIVVRIDSPIPSPREEPQDIVENTSIVGIYTTLEKANKAAEMVFREEEDDDPWVESYESNYVDGMLFIEVRETGDDEYVFIRVEEHVIE